VARVAGVNGVHWARPEKPLVQNAGFGDFISAAALALTQGQTFAVWDGQVNHAATPTLATEIGEMIVRIVQLDRQGIFHCTGGEGASRLDLALATARGFDCDPKLIRTEQHDLAAAGWPETHRVPKDTRLKAEHTAAQLEHPLLSLQDTVGELRRQMETHAI
jgi:dTDP-4-dehydrorhamnose reductase